MKILPRHRLDNRRKSQEHKTEKTLSQVSLEEIDSLQLTFGSPMYQPGANDREHQSQ